MIDRRRELGLLRFLGRLEAAGPTAGPVRGGAARPAGEPGGTRAGHALSLVLIFVINKQSFGWTIQFHWPVAVLLGALTVVYVATLLAGLYPARVADPAGPHRGGP